MKDQKSSGVQRTILYQNEFFEVVSIAWAKEARSSMHDHGWSQCQVLVQEGMFENTLHAGMKTELRILETGQVQSTPLGARHEMRCLTPSGKTLHVYVPKIKDADEDRRKFNSDMGDLSPSCLRLGESIHFEQLTELLRSIRKNSISTNSPYFMNQLFSGIHPQALAAEEVVSQTKTTMATWEASPVFSEVEVEVVDKLCQLIGWKINNRDGVSVPGGSAANFMALHLAKQKAYPETKILGNAGRSFKIFVSADAHYSFLKASISMGYGTDAIVKIAVDKNGKMDCLHLEESIQTAINKGHIPLLVCATAGTTVHGAFDPIEEIHQVCVKWSLWLHVDAAWGGPALFSKKTRSLINHVDLADSVTFDAHKLFGAAMTCSFLLTQHQGLLLEANDVSGADYLFHDNGDEIDRGKMSWQCGRKADALSFWSIWKNLGTEGLGDFVDRLVDERDQCLDWIQTQPRLQLVQTPSFLNLCVRVLPPDLSEDPEWSRKVREVLKNEDRAMVNFSTDRGGTFLRLILAHPQLSSTHLKNILSFALEAI